MKYVVLKVSLGQGVYKAFPYIFCEHDTHAVMAEYMKHMLMHEMKKEAVVHSGGFCQIGDGQFSCQRGSETLKIPKEAWDSAGSQEDARLMTYIESTSGILYD